MLKTAIIGAGGISRSHIAGWNSVEGAELVALCDIRPECMKDYTDKRQYTDFDEMLENEEIDILDICLPTYLHADYAVRAMERGINVLCEKPLSLRREDVSRVYGAAEKNNVKVMIAQVLRFWPEYMLIKDLYDKKTYGRLLSGSMSRLSRYPGWSWDGWMADENRSGLVPFDLHIHDLDFLVWAFGKPESVSKFRSKLPYQDYVRASYSFGGFSVTAEAAWFAAPYPFSAGFRFQFENALAVLEGGKLTIYEREGKVFCPIGNAEGDTGNIGLPASNAYVNEIRYFADCVKNNAEPERVKPCELETVIDILNSLSEK